MRGSRWSDGGKLKPAAAHELQAGAISAGKRGNRPTWRLVLAGFVFSIVLLSIVACAEESSPQSYSSSSDGLEGATVTELTSMAITGEGLFNTHCSLCHGINAAGTGSGPTLINRIYYPGHHPDSSFRNATRRGVSRHHWGFGDMPPVSGLAEEDVEKISCYVREMQRANGIFEGEGFSTVC